MAFRPKNGSRSVSELVSYLKSAFPPIDFGTIERFLLSWDEQHRIEKVEAEAANKKALCDLMEEVEARKKEIEAILEQNEDLRLEKCLLENEGKRLKMDREVDAETILRLKEENKLARDKLSGSSRNPPLENEKEGIASLKNKIRILECEKRKAEAEVEDCMSTIGKLSEKISSLEREAQLLRKKMPETRKGKIFLSLY